MQSKLTTRLGLEKASKLVTCYPELEGSDEYDLSLPLIPCTVEPALSDTRWDRTKKFVGLRRIPDYRVKFPSYDSHRVRKFVSD